MMPNPYHEWSRQESADRVRKAWQEGRGRDIRRKHRTDRAAIAGLMIVWTMAMAAIVIVMVMAL